MRLVPDSKSRIHLGLVAGLFTGFGVLKGIDSLDGTIHLARFPDVVISQDPAYFGFVICVIIASLAFASLLWFLIFARDTVAIHRPGAGIEDPSKISRLDPTTPPRSPNL